MYIKCSKFIIALWTCSSDEYVPTRHYDDKRPEDSEHTYNNMMSNLKCRNITFTATQVLDDKFKDGNKLLVPVGLDLINDPTWGNAKHRLP